MQDNPINQPKIQAYLAHRGVASRRKIEELIVEGKITVNGQLAQLGQRVSEEDKIVVNGVKIAQTAEKHVYILINKPAGFVSSTSDELGRPTVVDYWRQQPLAPTLPATRLYPVGRLDLDSEGLMLLTNDGELTHHLTHPSFSINKTYLVSLSYRPTEIALDHLRRGVRLKEGYTHPAEVTLVEPPDLPALTGYILDTRTPKTWLTITIHEGRNHQVRRMLERVGYPVTRLIRIAMGPWKLADLKGLSYQVIPKPASINSSD
jgi:23S rRNA pseudouridine2605 synthase